MTHPVTHGELLEVLADYPTKTDLREVLADYPTKADLREVLADYPTKAELRTELERFATKGDLETWGGALGENMRAMEQRLFAALHQFEEHLTRAMHEHFGGMEQRLTSELRQHTRASAEDLATQVSAVDDKYRDLPDRVTKLETKVFTPKRRSR